jgi:hypothetical protein
MKTPKDVVKGIIYGRGIETVNNETKHLSLVCMIIASDEPLVKENDQIVVMGGVNNLVEEINKLTKYKEPYKLGNIGMGILDISYMSPDDLEEI